MWGVVHVQIFEGNNSGAGNMNGIGTVHTGVQSAIFKDFLNFALKIHKPW